MTTLHTDDGVALAARWDEAADPRGAVVFCHPHPLHGGTMNAPLMVRVTEVLTERGLHVLRFDFRGAGGSGGTHGVGVAELHDVDAAVRSARRAHPDLPLGLCGWSFGAATALRWEAETGSGLPYVGIAPPVRVEGVAALPEPAALPPATRSFVLGDRDQFVTVEELDDYARRIGATLHVLPASDHFFYFREARVGELVAGDLLDAFGGTEPAVAGLGE